MLTKTLSRTTQKSTKMMRAFGGHAAKEYDWRDDPKYNPDLSDNPRFRGWKVEEYEFPYQGHKWDWDFTIAEHDKSNINLVANPFNAKFKLHTTMPVRFL